MITLRASVAMIGIAALFTGVSAVQGCGGGSTETSPRPAAATPTFTPGPGRYSSPRQVTISTATADATLHYTTDGTAPTACDLPRDGWHVVTPARA